jgi:hypothetical protein
MGKIPLNPPFPKGEEEREESFPKEERTPFGKGEVRTGPPSSRGREENGGKNVGEERKKENRGKNSLLLNEIVCIYVNILIKT